MDRPPAIADPTPDRIDHVIEPAIASHHFQAAAGSPEVCKELDRYGVAVILRATYEWGGYRYSHASDAIAAAKRAAQ